MLGWFKNWRTRNAGENFARTIVSEIDSYIENVIVPRLTSGLEVFSDILATVWDAPPHDPKEVAQIERRIYDENLVSFLGEARAMVRISTYKWDDVIDKLDGFRDVLDRLIETRIGDRATNARQLADKMVELTCEEIDRRLAEHSSGATVDHARKWSPLYVIVHGKESTSPHSG